MTDLVMTYTVNPISYFLKRAMKVCEVIGYSRAAAELARQGRYEEAKSCILMVENLKKSK